MSIKNGDKVSLDYEGKLEDGTVFDSSKHGDHSHPLEFTIGENMVIPGFEKAVLGLEVGDEKTFKITANEAYGETKEELKQKIPKEAFPKDQEVKEGMVILLNAPNGEQFPVKIDSVTESEVVVDLNHPLAGKDLTFSIKILEIK